MADETTACTGGRKPVYTIKLGWDGNSWDVLCDGERVRRGFDSEGQAQDWIDQQVD